MHDQPHWEFKQTLYIVRVQNEMRADLQLPVFVNQTNAVNYGYGTNAKKTTVQQFLYTYIQFCHVSTIPTFSHLLAFFFC